MPFLKPIKTTITKLRIDACKKNGTKRAIFTSCLSPKKSYTGEWKDDKKHGKGSEFNEGTRLLYEGDWWDDKKDGFGELLRILPDKSRLKLYSGNWKNDKRQGFGRSWWDDGGYYEGFFCMDKRHGFGRMWVNDDTFYQGTWKNDFYHGEGMLVLANGNRFEGFFSDGKKQGPGIFYHINTGQLQEGFWLADNCVISTLEDIHWRQSAKEPTSYPIPKNGLMNIPMIVEKRITEVSTLYEPEVSSLSSSFDDYKSENCQ